MKKNKVLYITEDVNEGWQDFLSYSIDDFATVEVCNTENYKKRMLRTAFDLIFVDMVTIAEPETLIQNIRILFPDRRIIVTTAIPNWIDARNVLVAGAIDCITQTYDKNFVI